MLLLIILNSVHYLFARISYIAVKTRKLADRKMCTTIKLKSLFLTSKLQQHDQESYVSIYQLLQRKLHEGHHNLKNNIIKINSRGLK